MIMKRFTLSILTFLLAVSSMAQGHHATFNSSEAVAPATSELISVYYDKYVMEVLQKTKEKHKEETRQNMMSVVSDYARLSALPSEMISEINRFVVTSLADGGADKPDAGGNVLFFVPSCPQTADLSLLYLFVQGQCVGVGSVKNGLVAILSYESCDPSAFYDAVVLACHDDSKAPLREVFSSSIMFKLKREYVFEANWKKKTLDALLLK